MNAPEARSPYRSQLRAQQAAATRQLILDTATRLFLERGYGATSIDLIAETAGVSRSTVFSAAGGKAWLLKTSYDRAIVGDDEPVPLLERPQVRAMFAMTDPHRIVEAYAGVLSDAVRRVSPLYDVVRSASGLDAEVQQLWTDISTQRLTGAKAVAALLKKRGGLRNGLTVDVARDIIWVYNDPGLHFGLVHQRGWSDRRYRTWLFETFSQQLLTSPPGTRVQESVE